MVVIQDLIRKTTTGQTVHPGIPGPYKVAIGEQTQLGNKSGAGVLDLLRWIIAWIIILLRKQAEASYYISPLRSLGHDGDTQGLQQPRSRALHPATLAYK